VRDPIREVWRRDIEGAHAGVQARERVGVGGRCDLEGRRFVVGPQRHIEAVTLIAARRYPRLQRGDWAPGLGEPLRELDLEPCVLVPDRGDAGEHVARPQSQRELVRVLEHDRVVSRQLQRDGDRDRRVDRARDVGWFHRRILTSEVRRRC
jgi:hypothetical protein